MSTDLRQTLAPMVRKLELWNPLSAADRDAVLRLPYTVRDLTPQQYIVWDGDRPQYSCLLLSGFAYRQKLTGYGGRQIMSLHMKGDLLDLQNSLLGIADHSVQMLTAGQIAVIPVEAVREIAFQRPSVGMAMWYETLVEGSIFREWIVNVGRRDALTRVSHLLCEFAIRLEVAELGEPTEYHLPMTQEQLADAVGLTPVHVNRMLKKLTAEGLITRTKRVISISDWKGLAEVGDFEPRYLHLQHRQAEAG